MVFLFKQSKHRVTNQKVRLCYKLKKIRGYPYKMSAVRWEFVQCGHFSDKGRGGFFRCGRPHF